MKNTLIILVIIFGFVLNNNSSKSKSLNTDISQQTISINSSFTGKKILLFGNREVNGEIVIEISGPNEIIVVHQKKKIFGIWINSKKITFSNVPSYYALVSSKPINDLISKPLQKKLLIGSINLPIHAEHNKKFYKAEIENFKKGLIRNKERMNLYLNNENAIKFNDKLFRGEINFPTNTSEGSYKINTYLIDNNTIIDKQEKSIFISKVGLERNIYNLANDNPALYGFLAIVIAVVAGFLASIVFRRI